MGCASSTHTQDDQIVSKKVRLPPHWSSQTPLSLQQLERQRDEFWDTRVEGQQLIWETLKAAVEASWTNLELANTIVESAGIIVASNSGDLSLCYDERGGKYEIPCICSAGPKLPCSMMTCHGWLYQKPTIEISKTFSYYFIPWLSKSAIKDSPKFLTHSPVHIAYSIRYLKEVFAFYSFAFRWCGAPDGFRER